MFLDIIQISLYENVNKWKYFTICRKTFSNLQLSDTDSNYYQEVSNSIGRGCIAETNVAPMVFDLAVRPVGSTLEERMRSGFKNILEEKIRNDVAVYDRMLEDMKEKGIIKDVQAAKLEIKYKD